MLRHVLQERDCSDVEVMSAGTWADAGSPATDDAVAVTAASGGDLSRHRSRSLTPDLLEAADVVIAMTSVHLGEIRQMSPDALNKVRLAKELVELRPTAPGLGGMLAARRPEPRRSLDVDDPIGLPITAYQRCARELAAAVAVLADALCG